MTVEILKDKYFVREEDLQHLRRFADLLRPEMPGILDKFYQWMRGQEEMLRYFSNQGQMEHVKHKQLKHWEMFFEARLDETYIKSRIRIGELHARVGLPLDTYFSGVLCFNQLFEEAFMRLEVGEYDLLRSYNKMVCVDVSIVVDTYSALTKKQMEERNNELATPVAQLWEGILFLPLVGLMDSKRASKTMHSVLKKISEKQSRAFILDISGISVVDTAVANHLLKIVKAARLMGCYAIVSGLSPEVAQTIVELGINTDEISTTGTMTDALRLAFRSMNLNVIGA